MESADGLTWRKPPVGSGAGNSGAVGIAVGETVIFADIPSPSLLKHLLEGEGGAAE